MSPPKPISVTETKARQVLRQNLGKHLSCPKCSRKKYVRKLKGSDKRYHCTKCRYKFSLKTVTGFKHANLSYRQVYHTMRCFSDDKTLKDVRDWADVSYPTARLGYDRIRTHLERKAPTTKLYGRIICDESFVGRQKTDNQALLMGGVDKGFTEARLQVIPDRGQDSIEGFIHAHVEELSMIVSDGLGSYLGLPDVGYGHEYEVHEDGQFELTSDIERVWALFDTMMTRSYHHITKEKLADYAVEFQYKFNHRKQRRNPLYLAKILSLPVPDP